MWPDSSGSCARARAECLCTNRSAGGVRGILLQALYGAGGANSCIRLMGRAGDTGLRHHRDATYAMNCFIMSTCDFKLMGEDDCKFSMSDYVYF